MVRSSIRIVRRPPNPTSAIGKTHDTYPRTGVSSGAQWRALRMGSSPQGYYDELSEQVEA